MPDSAFFRPIIVGRRGSWSSVTRICPLFLDTIYAFVFWGAISAAAHSSASPPLPYQTSSPAQVHGELVGGMERIGVYPPVPHQFRIGTGAVRQPDDGAGGADIEGEQHSRAVGAQTSDRLRGLIRSDPSGACAGSEPSSTARLRESTKTTFGSYPRNSASSIIP